MKITKDIKSITYLKNNAAEVLQELNKDKRPFIITQNGEPKAVLLDPGTYEELMNTMAMLKLVSMGSDDIKAQKYTSLEDTFDYLQKVLEDE